MELSLVAGAPIGSGKVVDGRYRVLRRLAVGGMAEIYLARATGLEGFEKQVVLKRILPQLVRRPELVDMFLDEARLAATLHHPNIAQVFDMGRDGESYYFAMEHVDGLSVDEITARAGELGRPVPIEVAVALAIGVAAGLHAAHETRGADGRPLGVVHRDVSPTNVIATWDGNVKVIDFGIAKAERRQTRTRTGALKGKTRHMSPEQCLSEPLDRRSDIFSLGILLWELSCGGELFGSDSDFETMRRIVDGEIKRPGAVRADYPPALEAIVMRALARDPADRHETARDLLVELYELAQTLRLNVAPYVVADYLAALYPDHSDTDVEVNLAPLQSVPAVPAGASQLFERARTARLVREPLGPTVPIPVLAQGSSDAIEPEAPAAPVQPAAGQNRLAVIAVSLTAVLMAAMFVLGAMHDGWLSTGELSIEVERPAPPPKPVVKALEVDPAPVTPASARDHVTRFEQTVERF